MCGLRGVEGGVGKTIPDPYRRLEGFVITRPLSGPQVPRVFPNPLKPLRRQNVSTAPSGRGFHERATPCQHFSFSTLSAMVVADQREAPQALSLVFPSKERFCFSPPTRPASIRTLSGAVCSGASWSPQSQIGCCHLSTELSRPVSGYARSAATSQSPELGDGLQNETTFS